MQYVEDGQWRGILIEASLTDLAVLDELTVVNEKASVLEGEPDRGRQRSWRVEVGPPQLGKVIAVSERSLRHPGWYFHLTRENEMVIVYPRHTERFTRDDPEGARAAISYGIDVAKVPPEQIEVDRFFGNAFDD